MSRAWLHEYSPRVPVPAMDGIFLAVD
jgi:hypothetical protein